MHNRVPERTCRWYGRLSQFVSSAKDVLASLAGGHDLKGYSALWNYLAGSAAYQADQAQVAQEHFSAAFSCASTLPWLKQIQKLLSSQTQGLPVDVIYGERIERIEGVLERFGKSGSVKIEKYFQAIREGLSSTEAKTRTRGGSLGDGALFLRITRQPERTLSSQKRKHFRPRPIRTPSQQNTQE